MEDHRQIKMNDKNSSIYIAGHNGMVGSAILNNLISSGIPKENIITRSRDELDLLDQKAVFNFLLEFKPSKVYIAAAKVGGIYANNNDPASFIYENLVIQNNLIHGSFLAGVKDLLFLGSSCIYPKLSNQPMKESDLLSGYLEATNEPYAIAKIAGIKMCESYNRQYGEELGLFYKSIMPTNLYGPGDNYDDKSSHVLPALISRFHNAKINNLKSVLIWGTGTPLREFLHVDDMAKASIHVMNLDNDLVKNHTQPQQNHINIGSGDEISIFHLAQMCSEIIEYKGQILLDESKPDGTPRKLLDSTLIRSMGWSPKISLRDGIKNTYAEFLNSN